MNRRIWSLIPAVIAGTGLLPAADPQLLNLVMPNAKILAGVNVDQAKTSPFGQYVISQIQAQNQALQQLISQAGFDPTLDLDELLLASAGAQSHTGLTLARGTFQQAALAAAAQNAGATSEVYQGVTILEDPKHAKGFAILSPTIGVAGDVASVKGAIDRQNAPTQLPATLLVQIDQLSTSEDAWAISEVPPPALQPPSNNGNLPAIPATAFQSIQQATTGVKLGTQILMTAVLQSDTAADATAMAGVLQLLVNLGQLQTQQKNPAASSVLQAVSITTNQSVVNVSLSVPEATAESLFPAQPQLRRPAKPTPHRRDSAQ